MSFRVPRIAVAVPTIPERGHLLADVEAAWRKHTCQPVDVVFSWAPGGWGAGLNEIWEQLGPDTPEVFCLSSDDMVPMDDYWLPPLLPYLMEDVLPAPCVVDPRFVNYGGHPHPVPDGTPSEMASFIVIDGRWGDLIFPLPDDLSYYADNLVCVLLREAGIRCVAVPSSRIQHLWAQEGRGFGHGSEEAAMHVHSARYTQVLAERGIDRGSLPAGLRGPLYAV